ncbi:MAG: universal stress protein [Desulfobacterales bacterium]
MEKVLLAIDGMRADQQVVDYAAKLCQRIKAELNILHIIDPEAYASHLKKFQQRAHRVRDLFESSMMAATFAETGEYDTAKSLLDKASAQINQMLSDTDKKAVKYRVQIKPGEADQEIIKHVKKHRDIVLTIYDDGVCGGMTDAADNRKTIKDAAAAPGAGRRAKVNASELQKALSVPLVVRRFLTIANP